ncbi:helix-turn-helix domain-containing protein [Janthinobacterium fluminis]|uniref:Helix-turn-helix domain-containing protein n=1 Tax=Janthinobacterium fluminis TaxID=2987524 RepID=A0ABT5JXM2_9BURK|nr:helix-turn-helix domain-containing protein [Janthinobacterium fluminis]MDC8757494.1 helix-turn-helix domain-containing protein [Janthinobacterium fluminis]
MDTFGQRLKSERKRLRMTQPELALVGKVEKGTQINYEQDKRFPSADYLIAVAAVGVDTHYVLHGTPAGNNLTDDENELLIGYRKLDLRGKARVLGVVEGIAEPANVPASVSAPKSAPRTQKVVFHGEVGQQVSGDISAPQTINVGRSKK